MWCFCRKKKVNFYKWGLFTWMTQDVVFGSIAGVTQTKRLRWIMCWSAASAHNIKQPTGQVETHPMKCKAKTNLLFGEDAFMFLQPQVVEKQLFQDKQVFNWLNKSVHPTYLQNSSPQPCLVSQQTSNLPLTHNRAVKEVQYNRTVQLVPAFQQSLTMSTVIWPMLVLPCCCLKFLIRFCSLGTRSARTSFRFCKKKKKKRKN